MFLIVILLGSSVLAFANERNSFVQGLTDGKLEAERYHSSMGWGLGGLAGQFILGIVGGLCVTGASALSNPNPSIEKRIMIDNKSEEYQLGFIEGFKQEAKSKNIKGALGGCGIGLALRLVLALATQ